MALELLLPAHLLANPCATEARVLGIDLGTTNSAAAEIKIGSSPAELPNVQCIAIPQKTRLSSYKHVLIPSVVAIDGDVEYIGEGAKRLVVEVGTRDLKQNRNVFWECKNDIGLMRTYHLAPEGYRSACEIGAKVLSFIKSAAEGSGDAPIARTVVTVPASFQTAQRMDTMKAAKLAGIKLTSGDLLDEPVAAFLDYVISHPERVQDRLRTKSKLLVFDFGGGTCDVAIFELEPRDTGIDISARAVSRYHRLGGGDIDRAIIYNVLLPQICKENDLGPHDLGYEEKRMILEPALLATAEALKVQLCQKITELKAFGQYKGANLESVVASLPPLKPIAVLNRTLMLSAPRISAKDFESVLEPFIDQDLLCVRETEYCLTNSIFTPLNDALDRASLDRSMISMVLLVGGSSLIPHIQEAVRSFFSAATLLTYDDVGRVQTTVARGAAFHAFTLEKYGKPIFRPVAHDSICVRSTSGLHELVEKGEAIPRVEDQGWRVFDGLSIAHTNLFKETPLRLEFITGTDERLLFRQIWQIPPPVNAGDRLRLEFRFNENQLFEFKLSLADRPEHHFRDEIENPLTHVVNPQSARIKIEEIEEGIRQRSIPAPEIPNKGIELAKLYAELGQHERAIGMLEKTLRMKGRADSHILNLLGIYCGNLGDHERQAKFYRESARAGGGSAPLFNLALAQKNRRQFQEAFATLDELERYKIDGPGLTLKAQVIEGLSMPGRESTLQRAIDSFRPLSQQDDWELGWFSTAARMKSDNRLLQTIEAEQSKRRVAGQQVVPEGELPAMHLAVVRQK